MTLDVSFHYDCMPYFAHAPLMSHDPGVEPDGNGILYAGTYGLIYFKLFGRYPEGEYHSHLIWDAAGIKEQPGVITRGPHKWEDPQTHDDYVGLATLSLLGDKAVAKMIVNHGRNSFWSYTRNRKTSWAEWFNCQFWRIPGVIQHFKLCAGESLGILDSLLWAGGVYFSSLGSFKDTSGAILTWHMVSAYNIAGKKNWLCDWAVRKWVSALNAKSVNGMGSIFGIYYSPNHPFAKWALGII